MERVNIEKILNMNIIKKINKKYAVLLSGILLLFYILLACNNESEYLVVGIVPSESPEVLKKNTAPLIGYLEKETGFNIKIFIPGDYRELISAMENNSIDIGYFGPFSYVAASTRNNIDPLLVRNRKNMGLYYNSVIITKKNSGIQRVEDLRNKTFAFVNSASTSGYIIPQSLFTSRSIDIGKFFSSFHFSGSHDKVINDVLDGRANAGAVSNSIFLKLKQNRPEVLGRIRIIWKSENIPGSLFAVRKMVSSHKRDMFLKAMIKIHKADPETLKSFDKTIDKFVTCSDSMYNGIRNIANILGKEYIEKNFL